MKFGRLTVLDEYVKKRHQVVLCQCDCGKRSEPYRRSVLNGSTKSCGCYARSRSANQKGASHWNRRPNRFVEHEGFIEGVTSSGKSFFFDADDFDLVKDITWRIDSYGHVMSLNGRQSIWMHRLVLRLEEFNYDSVVDHIDGDGSNNRKSNLRICAHSHNIRNHKLLRNNTSGVTGVCWNKCLSKWVARGRLNRKEVCIGYFNKFEDAVSARYRWELENYGEFSPLLRNISKDEFDTLRKLAEPAEV